MGSVAETEQMEVVVVGAGWNGLIAAKTYLEFRPNAKLAILDKEESIGGVWCAAKIYPSLYAQINHGLFEYSFYPMPREGVTKDGYISGATIHRYLNDFARDFGLAERTRLGTTVRGVTQLASQRWRLELEGKAAIECDKLIYASGATSSPVMPRWPRAATFRSPIVHSSAVGSHLDVIKTLRTATVVGGSKSSYDTVFLLLQAGVKVHWVIRADGPGPMALMPPTIFGLVNTMDVTTMGIARVMGASIMSTDGPAHWFFQRTLLGRWLAFLFWSTMSWVAAAHAGYTKSENAAKLRPLPHNNSIFWANASVGCASVPDFWKVWHAGDCTVHRTSVEAFEGRDTVRLGDGVAVQSDYVFLCTGFDKSYHVFSVEMQQRLGLVPSTAPADQKRWNQLEAKAEVRVDALLPVLRSPPVAPQGRAAHLPDVVGGRKVLHGPSRHYRRLVAPELAGAGDRSIYFPGFIHSIYTPMVSETQALWGVAFLLGLVDLPSQAAMEQEVAEWNVWSRKRYTFQGRRHAFAIYDFIPYIEQLLQDLGVNAQRKRGWFNRLFTPTYPREFKGLVEEFRQALAKKHALGGGPAKKGTAPSLAI